MEKEEMQRVLFVTAALTLVLGACAPATPTVDPAQIQASAVAAAHTMIALTQAAIPTNTPTPLSTDTPQPSPTLLTLPTLPIFATPTSGSSGGSDCNQLLDVGAAGPKAPVVIKNDTKGPITFSMGINTKNTFGQCGYMSWGNIRKGDSISVSVPQIRTNLGDSCYWAFAWINDPKHQTTVSAGGFCIDNSLKWTFDVSYDKIKLSPP
jgi:hypothetical protein